ncbi:hypothetical protein K437DRAFT_291945 [Tilletiaria anomala UBC 951]|uniref:5-oxoprolinase n=1 Tax=Tilletiaria anomala (strain ATCC 24038 / CBS 436.72 / UBC 951) TaxID=1037660 RepID=A0A066VFN1_TILAU|nr:uncharacterized protein K437DRAFT_291945 [Tilletiaria anomala UBC 951]KDN37579.1 hypothetical protein K437DRAFT_291945 [Tilletiaria anomala UBC 951]
MPVNGRNLSGSKKVGKLQIAIDRGGTFTDCLGHIPNRPPSEGPEDIVVKILSHDPENYKDAPREGVRRILEIATGHKISRDERIETGGIDYIRLSTTVATNALLERKGEKHALITTKGFKDIVQIGNQSRPRIFDLAIRKPEVLYSAVVEVDERVTLVGYTSDPKYREHRVEFGDSSNCGSTDADRDSQNSARQYNTCITRPYAAPDGPPSIPVWDPSGQRPSYVAPRIVEGVSGEAVAILKEPEVDALRKDLQLLYDDGYRSAAVVLIHSFTYPRHEEIVERVAKEIGFKHVSVSSRLMPMIKMVPRGTSSTADAYLTPVLQAYIDSFFDGFEESLRNGKAGTRVEFMMSDGGLASVDHFSGLKSIISGPAGGVVGMALTSYDAKADGRPVIGLDMGGTSTDVSRYAGRYEQTLETTMAGVTIESPQLDVNTVASGGSSRLFFRNGLFTVGPESASAHPGPTCYRKGGPLTITDANLVTGRLAVEMFPRIFGPNEDQGLDEGASKKGFEQLTKEINQETGKGMSVDEVAQGFIRIANETMCRPIRALTEARGYSASKHILSCFGGAGGQHACALARSLGIKTVLIHQYSSILSAYGMALADRVFEQQEPCSEMWDGAQGSATTARIQKRFVEMEQRVRGILKAQGFVDEMIKTELLLNMRYDGTDTALMTLKPQDGWAFEKAFVTTYKQEFGFVLSDKPIIVDDIRVRGIGRSFESLGESVHEEHQRLIYRPATWALSKANKRLIYFDGQGRVETPILRLKDLDEGDMVDGPVVLIDETQTILLEPKCKAHKLSKAVLIDVLYD